MTKFLNISTDNTLGGNSPSDVTVSSQKAVKEYVDAHGGGGSTAIDNLSITQNASLQIQTVGVINQNATTTAIKTWTGTKAQYNAITNKDANTLYNITDDTDVTLTLLEALYPVGSVYITTAASCPLSTLISGSTWTLRSSAVVTGINSTAPVKGTGKTLGFTDGTNNAGIRTGGSWSTSTLFSKDNYDVDTSSTASGGNYITGVLGVTTDASKSGIVADTSSLATSYSVNIFERTA